MSSSSARRLSKLETSHPPYSVLLQTNQTGDQRLTTHGTSVTFNDRQGPQVLERRFDISYADVRIATSNEGRAQVMKLHVSLAAAFG